MKSNPFTSDTYTTIWSKYFNESKPPISLDFIDNVKFIEHRFLPIHINVGKNLTKGINYNLNSAGQDYKGKTVLIYDVPEYFELEELNFDKNSTLKLKKLEQYKGFMMNLSDFSTHEEYINFKFNSKKRSEFRSIKRKLEECFDIKYYFLDKNTTEEEYNEVFKHFYLLLSKRYSDKQTNLHHLSSNKWNFYKELVYKMLLEEKASMLVVYNESKPIGIALNYLGEDILFGAMTVFDLDYYKFSVGKIMILKTLEWCFKNKYQIFDFSKGEFAYKYDWSNSEYDFYYHIYYDLSSIKSRFFAKYLELIFRTKFYLRKKNFNSLYRKFLHLLKSKKSSDDNNFRKFTLGKYEKTILDEKFKKIDYLEEKYSFLLQPMYVFLFANPESSKNVSVYRSIASNNEYIIEGSKKSQKITFH